MKQKTFILFFVLTTASLIALSHLGTASPKIAKVSNPEDARCLTCHDGIESISDGSVMSSLTCAECHEGNAGGATKEEAHRGIYANPADLRVAGKTCGPCHPEEVSNVKKSLHATMAGMISGSRYPWNAQNTKNAIYATYGIEDTDGDVPERRGAVKSLKQLPLYDPSKSMDYGNNPVDDYLR